MFFRRFGLTCSEKIVDEVNLTHHLHSLVSFLSDLGSPFICLEKNKPILAKTGETPKIFSFKSTVFVQNWYRSERRALDLSCESSPWTCMSSSLWNVRRRYKQSKLYMDSLKPPHIWDYSAIKAPRSFLLILHVRCVCHSARFCWCFFESKQMLFVFLMSRFSISGDAANPCFPVSSQRKQGWK